MQFGERLLYLQHHRLAGEWLETRGEGDAAVLAEHFVCGEVKERAVYWYVGAARQALAANDLGAVIKHAAQAVELGAAGEMLGEIALVRAEAHAWRAELAECDRWARMAMAELPKRGASWYAAAAERSKFICRSGAVEEALTFLAELDHAWAAPPALDAHVQAVLIAARTLLLAGRFEQARPYLARVDAIEEGLAQKAPRAATELSVSRMFQANYAGDFEATRVLCEAAVTEHERVGDRRQSCRMRTQAGHACNLLGAYADAARHLRTAFVEAEQMGLTQYAANIRANLGIAMAQLGELDEARTLTEEAIRSFLARGDRRLEGGARTYLSNILLLANDFQGAEAEVRRAVTLLTAAPPLQSMAIAALAETLLAQGRCAEALVEASRAMAVLEQLGALEEGEALVRVVHAEALTASGQIATARDAIGVARDRLLSCASKITNPLWRASFLERVPENARTLALVRKLIPAAET